MVCHSDVRENISPAMFRASAIAATLAVLCILLPAAYSQITSQQAPVFLPTVVYPSGANATIFVALADVNHDGNLDAIVMDTCHGGYCSGNMGVLLGNGDGTFVAAVNYATASVLPAGMAVADVNLDDNLDVIVVHSCAPPYCPGDLSVLLGNGDGTFRPAQTFLGTGMVQMSVQIAVEDVDRDGKPDLIVPTCTDQNCSGGVAVLLGKGDGTFQQAVIYSSGALGARSVAVADLNKDDKPDLLLATGCQSASNCYEGGVAVLLGNGDGTFRSGAQYSSGGGQPSSLAVADLNGDGKLDVVAANSDNVTFHQGAVGVLLGNGDGTLQRRLVFAMAGIPDYYHTAVAIADFNGDGKPDLALAAGCADLNSCVSRESVVTVLPGNGDGTFQPALTFNSGGYMSAWVAVGDLNGDATPDIVVANPCGISCAFFTWTPGSLGVLLNNSNPRNSTILTLTSSLNPSFIGQAVTFTAKVTSSAGPLPGGETVTFYNGSSVLATASMSGGSAVVMTSSLPTGILLIKATYPGDSNFSGSSASLSQVVNTTAKSATSTTLASSRNPSVYGQSVTFTARVITSGTLPPTGTVNFKWGNGYVTHNIGTVTLNASGVAILTKSNLNAAVYNLVAAYSGDVNNLNSTSPVLNQTVLQTTSAATLSASANPAAYGHAVTFTAQITSPTVIPSGPATFTAGTVVLGTAQLVGGKATLTTSSLQPGATIVKVTYAGNSNIAKSSASLTEVVQP